MKNNRTKVKLNYTLLELISAMAVFLIICLVVLRFFNGAQQLTTSSNSYNEMHSDAQAFFSLLGDDLKNIVYDNEISPRGIYPFAFSFYPIADNPPFSRPTYRDNIDKLYDDDFIPERYKKEIALEERNYVPLLCFMSTSSSKPSNSKIPLAEIRYSFLPVGTAATNKADTQYHGNSPTTPYKENLSGGKIIRSVTIDDGNKKYPADTNRHPHDSDFFPIIDKDGKPVPTAANRIYQVFGDHSSNQFEEVVSRVYRMNISCYKFDRFSGSAQYRKLPMFNVNKPSLSSETPSATADVRLEIVSETATLADKYLTWPPLKPSTTNKLYTYPADTTTAIELLQLGHPLPDMIKVDIYLLSPKDWNLFTSYYDFENKKFTDKAAAVKILDNKLRKFSRTFYINIKGQ